MFKGLGVNNQVVVTTQVCANTSSIETGPPTKAPRWVNSVSEAEKKDYDKTFARMIFDTALPFNFASAPSVINCFKKIRPAYTLPTRKQLSTSLLDDEYDTLTTEIQEKLNCAKFVSIVSDGWSNIRMIIL